MLITIRNLQVIYGFLNSFYQSGQWQSHGLIKFVWVVFLLFLSPSPSSPSPYLQTIIVTSSHLWFYSEADWLYCCLLFTSVNENSIFDLVTLLHLNNPQITIYWTTPRENFNMVSLIKFYKDVPYLIDYFPFEYRRNCTQYIIWMITYVLNRSKHSYTLKTAYILLDGATTTYRLFSSGKLLYLSSYHF